MERLLEIARKAADRVEVYSRATTSDNVSFENARLKDIDSSIQSGVALRIIKGGKLGTAYTQNLIDREGLVRNALASLKGGVEGSFEFSLTRGIPPLDAYDSAIERLTSTQMVDECTRICAAIAGETGTQVNASASRAVQRIRLMSSQGASLTAQISHYLSYASAIFPGTYAAISHIKDGKGFEPFPDSGIGYIVGTYNRSVKEVKPQGGRMRVLFLGEAMYPLIWRLREGANGKNIYEKTSKLRDRQGQKILSEKLTIIDEPLDDRIPGARAFDDEGTACRNIPIVEAGVLRSFYCDLFYARKLGVIPTGHGYKTEVSTKPVPALEHLTIRPGTKPLADLLKLMDRGVIVGGAMGAHSGNILNGDYSIGLSPGIYVENGEIKGRVKDAMVAGNIYETLKNVIDIEDTVYPAYMGRFPAILFDDVSVAIGP